MPPPPWGPHVSHTYLLPQHPLSLQLTVQAADCPTRIQLPAAPLTRAVAAPPVAGVPLCKRHRPPPSPSGLSFWSSWPHSCGRFEIPSTDAAAGCSSPHGRRHWRLLTARTPPPLPAELLSLAPSFCAAWVQKPEGHRGHGHMDMVLLFSVHSSHLSPLRSSKNFFHLFIHNSFSLDENLKRISQRFRMHFHMVLTRCCFYFSGGFRPIFIFGEAVYERI